ncbi:MAG: hypothetical protein KGH79_04860 [Patescibacteria group bacterium]|nr:hypothetical protein [Patescibacteria group bacterium]
MSKHSRPHASGFVALISAILISAVLLALLVATNRSSFYARFDALDAEHLSAAQNLAGACVQEALLRLAQDYNYLPAPGGDAVSIGADSCMIASVSSTGASERVISFSAKQGDSYANEVVTAKVSDPSAAAGGPNITVISSQEQ